MGPFVALLPVMALNLVPAEAPSLTISNYVVEGIGSSAEPAVFRFDRIETNHWSMHSARGEPLFEVIAEGSVKRLISTAAHESVDCAVHTFQTRPQRLQRESLVVP